MAAKVTEARLHEALSRARAERDDASKTYGVRARATRSVHRLERRLESFTAKLRAIGAHVHSKPAKRRK